MPILSNLIVRIGASSEEFDKAVDKSLNKIKRFAGEVTQAGMALSAGFSLPVIAAGGVAIKAAADFEKLSMGLAATMRSSTAAAAEMEKLREVAKLPGLGLEEAVRGSVRLQTLGMSADKSRKIMSELGNAIATVGGSKEDFGEAIRQLSQMQSTGKVTKENLDSITDRAPQVAKIMLDLWGPQAVADPAKFFEKAGISSNAFIEKIIEQLSKAERSGNTFANSIENVQASAKQAAAELGKSLLPMGQRVLDEFLTPAIDKAKELAISFQKLSPEAQGVSVGIAAVAAAAPLAIVALGTLAEKGAILAGQLNKIGITGPVAGAALGGLALALKSVDEALAIYEKLKETAYQLERFAGIVFTMQADIHKFQVLIVNLKENFPDLSSNIGKAYDAIKNLANAASLPGFALFKAALDAINTVAAAATGRSREMDDAIGSLNKRLVEQGAQNGKLIADMENFNGAAGDLIPTMNGVADGMGAATEAAEKYAKAVNSIKLPTMDMLILQERGHQAKSEEEKIVKRLTDITKEYGVVTVAAAEKSARWLNTLFVAYRQLSDAPEIETPAVPFGKIPKYQAPSMPGNFEEFESMAQNIGKYGMLTEHAYEQIGRAARAAAAEQTTRIKAVKMVVNDLSQGLARAVMQWRGFGEAGKAAAMNVGQFLIQSALEKQLTRIGNQIIKMTADTGALGKVLGAVFGPAASVGSPVIKNAVDGGGGLSGMLAQGGGGAAAGAASSLMGTITAIASVGSLISGIVGNFQNMAMNKSLDLIEHEVRYSQIHLLNTLNKANEYWPFAKLTWESLVRMEQRGGISGGSGIYIERMEVKASNPAEFMEQMTRYLKQRGALPAGS